MREALERFRVAATGRWAVSIRVYVLSVPFAMMVNTERENMLNPGNFSRSFSICIAGELASYLYLFVAQATLLKHRRERPQGILKCAFVWFSTGTVKGIFFIIYAHWAYGYELDISTRMVLPTVFAGVAAALLAFYFGSIDRQRTEAKALSSLDQLLYVDQGLMVAADAQARNEVVSLLNSTLVPQIKQLRNLTSSFSATDTKADESLALLGLQSRELGEALDVQATAIARGRANQTLMKGPYEDISLLSGFLPKVISVRLTFLIIIVGMTVGQLTRNGMPGVASGIVGAFLIAGVAWVLRSISKKLQGNAFRAVVIAAYPIVFLVQTLYVANLSLTGIDLRNPYMPWYSALKTVYGFYLASVVASLLVDTNDYRKSLSTENKVISENLEQLDHDREKLIQQVFSARFGTIQGKISGVILALQLLSSGNSISSNPQRREEFLLDAQKLLDEALVEIEVLSMEKTRA